MYPPLFGALVGVTSLEFCQYLWHQITRVPRLSYGIVCMILDFVILANSDL